MPLCPRGSAATSESKEDNGVHRGERVILKREKGKEIEGGRAKALPGIISQLIKSSGCVSSRTAAWSRFGHGARTFSLHADATRRCNIYSLFSFSNSFLCYFVLFCIARCSAREIIRRNDFCCRGWFTISVLARDADCANDSSAYICIRRQKPENFQSCSFIRRESKKFHGRQQRAIWT